jgi:hypothetical protein
MHVRNMPHLVQSRFVWLGENSISARGAEFWRVLRQLADILRWANSELGTTFRGTAKVKAFPAPFTGFHRAAFCFQLIGAVARVLEIFGPIPAPAVPLVPITLTGLYLACSILAPFHGCIPEGPYLSQARFYDARLRGLAPLMLPAIVAAGRSQQWNDICALTNRLNARIGDKAPQPAVQIPLNEVPELLHQYLNLLVKFVGVIRRTRYVGLLDNVLGELEFARDNTGLARPPPIADNRPAPVLPEGYEDLQLAADSVNLQFGSSPLEDFFSVLKGAGEKKPASPLTAAYGGDVQYFSRSILRHFTLSQE